MFRRRKCQFFRLAFGRDLETKHIVVPPVTFEYLWQCRDVGVTYSLQTLGLGECFARSSGRCETRLDRAAMQGLAYSSLDKARDLVLLPRGGSFSTHTLAHIPTAQSYRTLISNKCR